MDKQFIEGKFLDFCVALGVQGAKQIRRCMGVQTGRESYGKANNGDVHFKIDEIAENFIEQMISQSNLPLAYFTEKKGYVGNKLAKYVLLIDPIDGTRGALANLETCCIPISLCPNSRDVTIEDIIFSVIVEIKSGQYFTAIKGKGVHYSNGEIARTDNDKLDKMFWAIELCGNPNKYIHRFLGDLIDKSAVGGGVFVFNSASFAITRVILGQLDAYIDIGNRVIKEDPSSIKQFENVGFGSVLNLFSYDIAAAVMMAVELKIPATDAFGDSLGNTKLLDVSMDSQQSCVVAINSALHGKIIEYLDRSFFQNKKMSKRPGERP